MQKPCEVGSAICPHLADEEAEAAPRVSATTQWQSQAQAACLPSRGTRHSLWAHPPLEGVGPLHMLLPGLEYSLHPTHPLLFSFCLILPMADLCKTYRSELGIKCSAK